MQNPGIPLLRRGTLSKIPAAFAVVIAMVLFSELTLAAKSSSAMDQGGPDKHNSVTVAALKFGTLNWELQTMQAQSFDRNNQFQLQVMPLAGMTATRTALKSGSADVIVADWMWVSRQRDMGDKLQFIPYSLSIGKVVLAKGSHIKSLQDLQGKRIGIAGGPLSKGWLLLRALGLKQGIDLKAATEQQYGAPPLLNASLERGRLDAVVTFWHFAARLEGQGYPVLTDLKAVSKALGMNSDLPMLGYVFHQRWAEENPALVASLQRASAQTKSYLLQHDDAWSTLRPMMQASDEAVFQQLKKEFLAGIPEPLQQQQWVDAQQMFRLLAELGGDKLVGDSRQLDNDTFWRQH
ncbi:ABC transporter substrate-binding protein [Neptunomonas antarctica]|uniref:NitT/TauT family transport system substrate-binding protein n=1 Tax=Neptunomonas antarctica TaxID=619304 RepID=A0A1N7N796_9GAMM|nr:ABC transporter substrate-binding protein [Neptunomonas antarctica]SIS94059.1 NitT/TauT family transport system substrate-binding protein [Neptunomonas antarctica]